MNDPLPFEFSTRSDLVALQAGLFVSRGEGMHPDRTIDSYELIFVRSGKLGMFEEDNTFSVEKGQTLLLHRNRHHGGTTPYQTDLSLYWIHFNFRTRPKIKTGTVLRLPQLATVGRPDRLTALYRHYLDDQETGRRRQETADLLLSLILCEAADTRPALTGADDAAATLANRAELFVRLHFHEAISASAIADDLHCNADYLGRVFHKSFGRTITEAIHQQRHQRARSLLLDGQLSIKEISRQCGFEDPGYFRRLFGRHEGMSPAAFRRLYSHMHVNTE